jgi:F-type H+-transporting ATPase subunit delta
VEVSEELKQNIIAKVQESQHFGTIELETGVDDKLIGGFILEFNNNLLDKSILRDVNDIRKQFSKNVYVLKIR